MRDLRSSAAYRISFAYAAAFAFGIALLGAVAFYAIHLSFVGELDTALAEQVAALREEYRGGGNAELGEAIAKLEAVDTRDISAFGVFDRGGKRLYGNFAGKIPAKGFSDISISDRQGQPDAGRALVAELGGGDRLVAVTDLEPVDQVDRKILTIFAAGFAGVVALGFAAALLLGSYLRGRLERLNSSAAAIIAGDIARRMPVSSRNDEFDQLAATLNAMLERIERLLENLRQVSSDVAHDLRTPLTRLRNQLEAGQASLSGEQPGYSVVSGAIGQVDHILALFAAILRISEIESGEIVKRFVEVDLSELVNEIAESYAPAIEEQGRSLEWRVDPGVLANIDRDLMAQALINLVENAQRHTPSTTTITIDLRQLRNLAILTVADDGPGVSSCEWPKLSQRFVRLDRSRGTSGHGLGLNLVDAVARLHGGTLTYFDNAPGFGTKLTISVRCKVETALVRGS